MRAFLFAWVATTFRRLRCQHVWTFDGTVLRSAKAFSANKQRCVRCGASQVTYQSETPGYRE